MLSIIWTIVIGFVVGVIAKLLTPGRDPAGFFITAAIGIGGSLLMTFVGKTMGWYQPGQSAGFLAAIVGAIILLVAYHLISRRS
jgi:uncharacterized membrane protein YeaQ/YmgE (transglycosylase-associated protein family)